MNEEYLQNLWFPLRKRHVMQALHDGCYTYADVGKRLGISVNTVRNHLHEIYKATGAKNRLALMQMAPKYGWVVDKSPSERKVRRTLKA